VHVFVSGLAKVCFRDLRVLTFASDLTDSSASNAFRPRGRACGSCRTRGLSTRIHLLGGATVAGRGEGGFRRATRAKHNCNLYKTQRSFPVLKCRRYYALSIENNYRKIAVLKANSAPPSWRSDGGGGGINTAFKRIAFDDTAASRPFHCRSIGFDNRT